MTSDMTREQKAMLALNHLRSARELLRGAGARRTLAKLRDIMDSAEGAVRAARYRDMRMARFEADKYPTTISSHNPSAEELCARGLGYSVAGFADDPGKFYWKTAEAVAFRGEDTIEEAWRAACLDAEEEAEG